MTEQVKRSINKDELYEDISNTVHVSKGIVKKICEYQFKTASRSVNQGKAEPIKFPYIGKMYRKI